VCRGDWCFEIDESKVGGLEEVGDIGEEGVPAVVIGVSLVRFGGFDDRLVGDDVSGGDEGDAGGFAWVEAGMDARLSAACVADERDGGAAEQCAEGQRSEEPDWGLLQPDAESDGEILDSTESGYMG
jgi:hypothetical protein